MHRPAVMHVFDKNRNCERVMAGDLLKELPSFNKNNFSKFKADSVVRCSHQRPVVYVPTKDTSDQVLDPHIMSQCAVIVTDKENILLRYLHQQWDNQHQDRKRDPSKAELPNSGDYKPSAKVARRVGPSKSVETGAT